MMGILKASELIRNLLSNIEVDISQRRASKISLISSHILHAQKRAKAARVVFHSTFRAERELIYSADADCDVCS